MANSNKINLFKVLSVIVFSCFIVTVMIYDPAYLGEGAYFESIKRYGMEAMRYNLLEICFCIVIVSAILLYNFKCDKYRKLKIFGAACFAVIQTIAIDFYYFYSFIYIFNDIRVVRYNILCLIAYGTLFYGIESICFHILEIHKYKRFNYKLKKVSSFEKHTASLSFFFIMICWLPWLIIFYPGSMWFDMCYQIEQYYFGNYSLHPVFVTLCMGWCLDIGKIVFQSSNIGVFIYILLQTVVCAFAFSRVIRFLKEIKVSIILQVATLFFYGISPVFGAFMQIGTKDVLYCGLITLFTIQVVRLCIRAFNREDYISLREAIVFLCISILCVLYRKEAIIICVIVFFAITILCCKARLFKMVRKNITIFAGTIIAYFLFEVVVVNTILGSGSVFNGLNDKYSIPVQQVGRFVYYEDDLLDEEDRKYLDSSFSLGYEQVANNYNPYLSDCLRYNWRIDKDFWDIYISLFKRKPLVYLEATIANSYGYYSIIPQLPASIHDAPTNGTPGSRFEFYINRDPDKENEVVQISYIPSLEKARNKLEKYAYGVRKIVIINLIYSLGFYTWIYIIFILFLIKERKFKYIIAFLPAVLIILGTVKK